MNTKLPWYWAVEQLKHFRNLLTTQTHTIRRGALRFATQISPLVNLLQILGKPPFLSVLISNGENDNPNAIDHPKSELLLKWTPTVQIPCIWHVRYSY